MSVGSELWITEMATHLQDVLFYADKSYFGMGFVPYINNLITLRMKYLLNKNTKKRAWKVFPPALTSKSNNEIFVSYYPSLSTRPVGWTIKITRIGIQMYSRILKKTKTKVYGRDFNEEWQKLYANDMENTIPKEIVENFDGDRRKRLCKWIDQTCIEMTQKIISSL